MFIIYIYIPNIFQVQYKHHLDDIPADPPDLPRSYWRTVPVRMQQDVRAFGAPAMHRTIIFWDMRIIGRVLFFQVCVCVYNMFLII